MRGPIWAHPYRIAWPQLSLNKGWPNLPGVAQFLPWLRILTSTCIKRLSRMIMHKRIYSPFFLTVCEANSFKCAPWFPWNKVSNCDLKETFFTNWKCNMNTCAHTTPCLVATLLFLCQKVYFLHYWGLLSLKGICSTSHPSSIQSAHLPGGGRTASGCSKVKLNAAMKSTLGVSAYLLTGMKGLWGEV